MVLAAATRFSWRWLWHLGGPGLILVGLVDNSVIPTPGGMDILTVILTVKHRELWWYYGLMALAGSLSTTRPRWDRRRHPLPSSSGRSTSSHDVDAMTSEPTATSSDNARK